jgi:hypothetical protein
MKYQIYDLSNKDNWNSIVKSFSNYDVHYLYEYNYAFYIEKKQDAYLFYYCFNNTRAIYVFIKRDLYEISKIRFFIKEKEFYDIISPYGYGGFLIEGIEYLDVFLSFEEYCKNSNIITNTTRLHLFDSKLQQQIWPNFSPFNNIVRDLYLDENDLILDFNYNFRKNLKSSFNKGLSIEIDFDLINSSNFLIIYNSTMKRTNADNFYFFSNDFFQIINQMKENVVYFNVYFGKVLISSELVLYGPKYCYSFLGGTERDYFHLHPNHFLKFEIMKWAKSKNLEYFILGGGLGEDGIYKYKRDIAPKGIVPFFISTKVFNTQVYDYICKISDVSSNDNNKNFFPWYRK